MVALFAVIILQSSLGTKAAQINYQSLGQNGCRKYEDGFLVQWGISSATVGVRSTYFPLSFADTDYSVVLNIFVNGETNNAMVSTFVKNKYTSYFDGYARYEVGQFTGWKFFWIAVGRWKK